MQQPQSLMDVESISRDKPKPKMVSWPISRTEPGNLTGYLTEQEYEKAHVYEVFCPYLGIDILRTVPVFIPKSVSEIQGGKIHFPEWLVDRFVNDVREKLNKVGL